MNERRDHWENVYSTKREDEVSWFQSTPMHSLELIHATGAGKNAAILDVGGGASRLVNALLKEGYGVVSVLDLSEQALATAKARLGNRASQVQWIAADVTKWEPNSTYDLWHDRAAFHLGQNPLTAKLTSSA